MKTLAFTKYQFFPTSYHSAAECEVSVTALSELFIDRMSAMTGFLEARGISVETNLSSKGAAAVPLLDFTTRKKYKRFPADYVRLA